MNSPLMASYARLTGYYPSGSALEGGISDRFGNPLQTLQGYLGDYKFVATGRYPNGDIVALRQVSGRADYISVAADPTFGQYWLCIPTLEKHYGMRLPFRIVDTGDAFKGAGYSHYDICCATRSDTMETFMTEQMHPVVVLAT